LSHQSWYSRLFRALFSAFFSPVFSHPPKESIGCGCLSFRCPLCVFPPPFSFSVGFFPFPPFQTLHIPVGKSQDSRRSSTGSSRVFPLIFNVKVWSRWPHWFFGTCLIEYCFQVFSLLLGFGPMGPLPLLRPRLVRIFAILVSPPSPGHPLLWCFWTVPPQTKFKTLALSVLLCKTVPLV